MDHLALMALAILGALGWIVGARRTHAPAWTKVGMWPALIWLVVYFLIELYRAEPAMYSGRAEVSIWTLMIIAAGVFALLDAPKPDTTIEDDRGAHSA